MHANSWSTFLRRSSVLASSLAIGLAACSEPVDPSAAGGDTVAHFDGGSISAERLNQAVLGLSAESRPKDPGEREEWYGDVVRQLAIRDLLLDQARRDGLPTEPEMAVRVRETRKQIVVGSFVQAEFSVAAPTAEEIEQFYESNRDSFTRPEKREVFHIFLRPESGESRSALEARMERLRSRSLAGEPFALLARENSESQLRHDDGSLGWVAPGQLAPRLNDIVFALEEGVPSEVLLTDSGAHLFMAASVVDARSASLDEARPEIRRSLYQQRQSEAVAEFLDSQERDTSDFAPSEEEFGALLAGGDPNALVQRVGDWTLTAGELFERLGANRRRGPRPRDQKAIFALLQSLASGERLFQIALESDAATDPEIARAIEAAVDDVVAAEMQRRRLLDGLAAESDAVRAFFDERSRRFAGPLRLRVQRLSVPLGSGSGRVMSQLEEALPRLATGSETLEALAERVGGAVNEPAWETLTELQASGGRLRGRLAGVPVGGFSEPASNGREIELFHVLERSAPEVPDFESVRDSVQAAYLQTHGERLLASFVEDELARREFRIVPGSLARFAERATGLVATPTEES